MKTKVEPPANGPKPAPKPAVKIFGVGGAGVQLLDAMIGGEFTGASFAVIDTDGPSLAASTAPVKIQLETKLLRGLGTGGDPERGRALAEEQFSTLMTACEGATVAPLGSGLINQTFLVTANAERTVLQRLAPIFSPAINENIAAVTGALAAAGLALATYHPWRPRP